MPLLFIIVFAVLMIGVLAIAISVAIKKSKYMKSLLIDDIDIIIQKGDHYESNYAKYIESKLMADEAFDKQKAFTQDGKKTRYYWKSFDKIYDKVFPVFFDRPTKAKKYAFATDFANFIKYEHKNTQVKDFYQVILQFENLGFEYTPPEKAEDMEIDLNDKIDENSYKTSDGGDMRQIDDLQSMYEPDFDEDIHAKKVVVEDEPEEVDDNYDFSVTSEHETVLKQYVNKFVRNYFTQHNMKLKTSEGKSTNEYKKMYQSIYRGLSNEFFNGNEFTADYKWWANNIYQKAKSEDFGKIVPKYIEEKNLNLMNYSAL